VHGAQHLALAYHVLPDGLAHVVHGAMRNVRGLEDRMPFVRGLRDQDLDQEEASRLLREAKDEFAAHGFHPTGFIAPAWLLSAAAERATIEAGFRYTTTLRAVRDFTAGEEILSQSLVYSVRSAWRRPLSLGWNRMLFHRLAKNPLLRLGLHPPDIDHPRIWRQIHALVGHALRDRAPATYQEWLGRHSASRAPHPELT